MKLWQRMWLLFTVIWVVVAGLDVATILAFSDEAEWRKAVKPGLVGLGVPVLAYALFWAYFTWRERRRRAK